MSRSLTLLRPDDWHLHLRDGAALAHTVPASARAFRRAVVMPNLRPPVVTAEDASRYRDRVLAARPAGSSFEPLMTLYLTDRTTPAHVAEAAGAGFIVAAKLYPAGATTNSAEGVTDLDRLDDTLHALAEHGLVLCVHGEVTAPEVDIFDREQVFLDEVLSPLVDRVAELKVVLEHITTREGVRFVEDGPERVAGTLTAHHLLLNRNDLLVGGVKPHHYCLPILKAEEHRRALVEAATSGHPRFFLGTDSAPHKKGAKECASGCAGCYTAPFALEFYAEAFDDAGALDKLEAFASKHGPAFYGLPENKETITMVEEESSVPETLTLGDDEVVPLRAGGRTRWRLAAPALSALTLLVGALGCASTEEKGDPALSAADEAPPEQAEAAGAEPGDPAAVDEAYLRRVVTELSADRFAGRGPGSPGDGAARAWLQEELARLGYEPGMPDGTWQQPFDVVGVKAALPEAWRFEGSGGQAASFAFGPDAMAASGLQAAEVELDEAEVVFVGYGIQAPEEGWDDYAGVDVEGKVLLMLNDDPSWDPELFGGERKLYYGRWTYKYESAARQGTAGAIIIHTTPSAGYPWRVVKTSWSGWQFDLPAGDEPRTGVHGWLTEDAAREMVALGGHDLDELRKAARSRDFAPVPLGVKTSLTLKNETRRATTANVLGKLAGADPERKEQVVVLSAHHDHLGEGEPDEEGDAIYNGARDNASGVAQALAVAKGLAAAEQRPARSILVLLVGAEEQGLLGSLYYARPPRVPPGRLAANVNFELGNIWGPTTDVVVAGQGKNTLEDVLRSEAQARGRTITAAPDPAAGWYYRSDQLSFARIGVPALWFMQGREFEDGTDPGVVDAWIAERYHRPSDEVDESWRFDGMAADAALALDVVREVADADAMPTWREGDEFADERQAALEALAVEEAPERQTQTYSIVARDPKTGALGVAVQSHWFDVGAVVPWARAGVGAVATQALTNASFGPRGLAMLEDGKSAEQVVAALVKSDPDQDHRQLAVVDNRGRVAAHTGKNTIARAGDQEGEGYSIQANMMATDEVWPAMAAAFEETEGPLAERLLAALAAAQAEGGDVRGAQSAALLVVPAKATGRPWEDVAVDLRVADHPQPVQELRRLLRVKRAYEARSAGEAALREGRAEEAEVLFARAYELAPGHDELRLWEAVARYETGAKAKARRMVRRLVQKDDKWRVVLERLPSGQVLEQAAVDDLLGRTEGDGPAGPGASLRP